MTRIRTALAAALLAAATIGAATPADAATLTPGRIVGPTHAVTVKAPVYAEHGPTGSRLVVVEWNDGRVVAYAPCKHAGSPRCWNPRTRTVTAFHARHRLARVGEPGTILTD